MLAWQEPIWWMTTIWCKDRLQYIGRQPFFFLILRLWSVSRVDEMHPFRVKIWYQKLLLLSLLIDIDWNGSGENSLLRKLREVISIYVLHDLTHLKPWLTHFAAIWYLYFLPLYKHSSPHPAYPALIPLFSKMTIFLKLLYTCRSATPPAKCHTRAQIHSLQT